MLAILDIILMILTAFAALVLIGFPLGAWILKTCKHDWVLETTSVYDNRKCNIYRCIKCGTVKIKWEE